MVVLLFAGKLAFQAKGCCASMLSVQACCLEGSFATCKWNLVLLEWIACLLAEAVPQTMEGVYFFLPVIRLFHLWSGLIITSAAKHPIFAVDLQPASG